VVVAYVSIGHEAGKLRVLPQKTLMARAWDFAAASIEVPENACDLQRGWAKPRLVRGFPSVSADATS
jgi:hypothetical protein